MIAGWTALVMTTTFLSPPPGGRGPGGGRATTPILLATTSGAVTGTGTGSATGTGTGAASATVSESIAFADHLLDRAEPWRALAEYERALFLCGECDLSARVELRIAEAYRRAGDHRAAATQLRAAATSRADRPEGIEAARGLGAALEASLDPAAASDAYVSFARAHADDPTSPDLALLGVRTALRAHDPSRVATAVEVATTTAPEKSSAAVAGLVDLPRAIETTRPSRRSPVAAGILSGVLPGAGHAYTGRYRDALSAFAINAIFVSATVLAVRDEQYAVAGVLGGFEVLWYGGSVIGAVNGAYRYNARAEDGRWRELERKWVPVSAGVSWRF